MALPQPLAFVLMPFATSMTPVYAEGIVGLADAGYDVRRADDLGTQQNIMRDVVQSLERADLVVADLTGRNPNVMYEVALAHGMSRPTVLIVQSTSDIPFDRRAYRTILYDPTRLGDLRAQLRDLGVRHLAAEVEFGSPLTDFATGEVSRPTRRAVNRIVIRAREAGQLMSRSMARLTERDRELGQLLTDYRPRIGDRDEELLHRVCRSIDDHAVAQRAELVTFRRASEQYYSAVRELMRAVDLSTAVERSAFETWAGEVRITLAGTRALSEPLRRWRDDHLDFKGVHERLDRSIDDLRLVNDEELAATAISDADAAVSLRVAEERFDSAKPLVRIERKA